MWLHDPYVVDEWLRRHAETIARTPVGQPVQPANARGDASLVERITLAARVLADAALAARVRETRRDAMRPATPAASHGAGTWCA